MQWGLVGYAPRSWLSDAARFTSRHNPPPSMRAVSALKNRFGGHAVKRIPRSG